MSGSFLRPIDIRTPGAIRSASATVFAPAASICSAVTDVSTLVCVACGASAVTVTWASAYGSNSGGFLGTEPASSAPAARAAVDTKARRSGAKILMRHLKRSK